MGEALLPMLIHVQALSEGQLPPTAAAVEGSEACVGPSDGCRAALGGMMIYAGDEAAVAQPARGEHQPRLAAALSVRCLLPALARLPCKEERELVSRLPEALAAQGLAAG